MPQRGPLYCCVAGVKPNDLLQSDSGSEQWLWRNLLSSAGIARVPIKTTPTRVSEFMGFDAQRRPLYSCVAGVEPNIPPQSDPGLEQGLWSNLPSSAGIASIHQQKKYLAFCLSPLTLCAGGSRRL